MAHSDRQADRAEKQSTPVVLAFHKLQASFSFGVNNFSPKRFVQLLFQLLKAGYLIGEDKRDQTGKRLIFSFDDGYQHLAANLLPFMEQYQFRPLIFVPTALIGKSNSWDYSHWFQSTPHLERREIRELANRGAIFGSHGHAHIDLTALSERRLKMELRQSREILSDLAAQEITALSYPFGRLNSSVKEAAEWSGYKTGFTMRFPTMDDHPMSTGRIPIYGFDTLLTIQQKLGSGFWHDLERAKVLVTNRLSGGTILFNRLRRLE